MDLRRYRRDLLNRLSAIPVAVTDVPAVVVTPAPTPEIPDPAPTVTPARVELAPDWSTLPPELRGPGGQPALGAIVWWLWASQQTATAQEARSVTGRAVLTSGRYTPGATVDVAVTWDTAALAAPTDVTALCLPANPLLMGRVRARPTAVTDTSTTLTVTFAQAAAATLTAALPLTIEVVGRYNYQPPPPEDTTP